MRRLWAMLALAVVLLLQAAPLFARPGGGHRYGGGSSPSYSPPSSPGGSSWGGGSSGGGGGGGDGGAAIAYLILLCIEYPPLGVAVLGVGAVVLYLKRREAERRLQSWESFVPPPAPPIEPAKRPRYPTARRSVPPRALFEEALREADEDFSMVVFEDFVYALYAAYHEARGGSDAVDVRPYVMDQAAEFLERERRADVSHIVIGSMSIRSFERVERAGADWFMVGIDFESNMSERNATGREQGYFVTEQWLLARHVDAKSRPPDKVAIDECPNCGGALEDRQGNVCAYCNETLTPGRFDWTVGKVKRRTERRGPMLTGEVAERGTDLPTLVDPLARQRYAELTARDASFDWSAFEARVGVIFTALGEAWTSRDWKKARPFLSDQLFQMQLYWIEEYRRQKLINHTTGATLHDVTLAKVTRDKHFDALTVRIFASGRDYTTTEDGKLVSGSKTAERRYTEYWTLIRGAAAHKPTTTEPQCPNCGAELDVNMAGSCSYCRLKVTRGDFDWVLSRIEQDEAYTG